MSIEKIATQILKKSVRFVSKQKFNDKIDFEEQVAKFVSSIKSNLVRLDLESSSFKEDQTKQPYQHWQFSFRIKFDLEDQYIDSKVYDQGSVYIFPSKKLYEDINKKSLKMFNALPSWDSERLKATITGKARDY